MTVPPAGGGAHEPTAYGDTWAGFLDQWVAMTGAVPNESLLDFLVAQAGQAGAGPVLELGVGTGFVAIPLSERGLDVHGLDASQAMLDGLASHRSGEQVTAILGDFAAIPGDDRYALVYFCSSSIYCLPDQAHQVRCLRSVAEHLASGGRFVVNHVLYDDTWFVDDKLHWVQARGEGWTMHWDAVRDRAAQVVTVTRTLRWDDGREQVFPHRERYCSAPELDLMAELAGLRVSERWGGWAGEPFSGSGEHVVAYEPDG